MPDVEFDFAVSSTLRSAFSTAATQVSEQRGFRAACRSAGLTDFEGYFSTVFSRNGATQLGDLDEIATNLRLVSTKVGELEDAAREENRRREQAREWAARMADRNGVEKLWDGCSAASSRRCRSWLTPVRRSRSPLPHRGRGRPRRRGTGACRARRRARPVKLTTFASSSRGADDALTGRPATLDEQCRQFAARCKWAHLDASSVIRGLELWLTANGADADWAAAVAQAFAHAGSDGGISTLSNSAIAAALAAQGIAQNRTDIQIDPPTAYGSPPTTATRTTR